MTIKCPHCDSTNKFLSSEFCGDFVMCKKCYGPFLWESGAVPENDLADRLRSGSQRVPEASKR